MRSCLFLGALGAFLLTLTTVSVAQSDVLGTSRPSRGVTRPAGTDAEIPTAPASIPNAGGMTVSRDSKLTAGDQISLKIVEDHDPELLTMVTDTGEVEVNGLGRVMVSGRTTNEAQAIIASYLRQKYYHQATVQVAIVRKAVGMIRPFKVVVAGKVGRPGPQYFTNAGPLTLSEAVVVAGTNLYSDISKVRLTRGGKSTDYNVEQISKGKTDLDVRLQDGDQIYIPSRNWIIRNQ